MARIVNVPLDDDLDKAIDDYRRNRPDLPPRVRAIQALLRHALGLPERGLEAERQPP